MANGFPYRAGGLADLHVCIVVPRTCWGTVNRTRPRGKSTIATYWRWPWGQIGRGLCVYSPCLFSLSSPFMLEAACSMTKSNLCFSPTLCKWVEFSQKGMFPGDTADHCFILTSRSPGDTARCCKARYSQHHASVPHPYNNPPAPQRKTNPRPLFLHLLGHLRGAPNEWTVYLTETHLPVLFGNIKNPLKDL